MAATKIIVNHNGSLRVEGDFEVVDPEGKPFGLAGRTTLGLCRFGQQAVLRRVAQDERVCGCRSRAGLASSQAQAIKSRFPL
jgi:hypothetical protein